jgi:hypothetical protein
VIGASRRQRTRRERGARRQRGQPIVVIRFLRTLRANAMAEYAFTINLWGVCSLLPKAFVVADSVAPGTDGDQARRWRGVVELWSHTRTLGLVDSLAIWSDSLVSRTRLSVGIPAAPKGVEPDSTSSLLFKRPAGHF